MPPWSDAFDAHLTGRYIILTSLCWCSVGLANGVMLRTEVDTVTGQLSDTRQRFLGTRPPKLCAVTVRGKRAMLALSSRPWLGYSDMGRYNLTPLSYEALDDAASAHQPLLIFPCPVVHHLCAVNCVTRGRLLLVIEYNQGVTV